MGGGTYEPYHNGLIMSHGIEHEWVGEHIVFLTTCSTNLGPQATNLSDTVTCCSNLVDVED